MTSSLEKFSKWIQLKIYQLEVTLAVYMFTPAEKVVFYSILFLISSLTCIAMVLYFPQHVSFIVGRAWFYMHGDAAEGAVRAAFSGTANAITGAGKVAEATATVIREL
ncbi:hypothetical protein QBC44DRAFT_321126 [Cladorrhinum sp. PSN332]|nr:hypothetical protein QBC44DRAFT_321126 [Cladorrhinum sp. PSN332]